MNILAYLLRLVSISGITIVAVMAAYYILIHHNSTPEQVEGAYFNLIETMLVYVGGCLLLFISSMPNVIWKWDKQLFWQKAYLVGLVISFPGIGLGILMLVASMPK